MDYKKTQAPTNTQTRDLRAMVGEENVYEAVAVISKRANQIGVEIKAELEKKLQEFAPYTDNLEEVFEIANKSRFLVSTKNCPSPL